MSPRSQRLDWALLLPASAALPFDEVLMLGGDDELGQALVDHGLAVSWRRPRDAGDRSAFVIAWDDCPFDVERIACHVRPGGLLYMEIDRHRRGRRRLGPRSAMRGLARGGCRAFSAHIVTPDLAGPRRYLPLDNVRAIRWHLRALFVAGTPILRAIRASLAGALALPVAAEAALRLVATRYIVIATTADDDSSPIGVPMAQGGERAILVTSGYDKASRAVVLPFGADDRIPRFAVKVASSLTTTIGTLREHQRLIDLHAILPAHTSRALPKPIGMFALIARTACVQSCAPGPAMSVTAGRWGQRLPAKRHDLDVVVDWLTEFAIATRVDAATSERDWTLIYEEAISTIDLLPPVVELLLEAQRIAKSTTAGESAVHQHYDAGPWNVHIDGNDPMLIDWETDDLRPKDCLGPPLADILYLVTYWYFQVSRCGSERDEEVALVDLFATRVATDPGIVAARMAIDRALAGLGLERDVIPAVLAAVWAERAVYTHRRRARLGVPIGQGASRPEAYLRALASTMSTMCAPDGWWGLPMGRQPQ